MVPDNRSLLCTVTDAWRDLISHHLYKVLLQLSQKVPRNAGDQRSADYTSVVILLSLTAEQGQNNNFSLQSYIFKVWSEEQCDFLITFFQYVLVLSGSH